MTENVTENVTEDENVTSDLPEQVISAARKGRQLTLETAKKFAEALSASAHSVSASAQSLSGRLSGHLPGRQLAHRLPAPPFAEGLPKLPKLPESDAVRTAARDYAGQLLAEQRRFAGEVVAEQRRFAGELVSAVSGARAASEDAPEQDAPAAE